MAKLHRNGDAKRLEGVASEGDLAAEVAVERHKVTILGGEDVDGIGRSVHYPESLKVSFD